jgi:reverse gyrase
MVPGAVHSPKYKAKVWDGKKHLYNFRTKRLYFGLKEHVKKFCEDRDYECVVHFDDSDDPCSIKEIEDFAATLKLPNGIELRDYQLALVAHAMRQKRMIAVSAVNSGKSICQYILLRYLNKKSILIVPSKQLVKQMYDDFSLYSKDDSTWNVEEKCSQIMEGYSKDNKNHPIQITTWQSLLNQPKEWFKDYRVVLVDECVHGDTLIKTNNDNVAIKDIKIGDVVLTYNECSKKFEYNKVKDVYKNLTTSLSEKMFEINTDDGKKLKLTGNHKVLTTRGWVETKQLIENDVIINIP